MDTLEKLKRRIEDGRRRYAAGKAGATVAISLNEAEQMLRCIEILRDLDTPEGREAIDVLRGAK